MNIIVLKENKNELRVGLTPLNVKYLTSKNINIFVEQNAGVNAGFNDEEYIKNGAHIVKKNTLVQKIKEANIIINLSPNNKYLKLLNHEQLLISNCIFSNNPKKLYYFLKYKVTSLGLELINDEAKYEFIVGNEQIKGKFGVMLANILLSRLFNNITPGKIFGKIEGIMSVHTKYIVINYSVAAYESIKTILSFGGDVTLLANKNDDLSVLKNDEIISLLKYNFGKLSIKENDFDTVFDEVKEADVIINTNGNSGSLSKITLTFDMFNKMKTGAVIVDLSADHGFCSEIIKKYNTNKKFYTILNNNVMYVGLENILSLFPNSTSTICGNFIVNLLNTYNGGNILEWIKNDKSLSSGLQTYNGDSKNVKINKSLNL